MDTGCALNIVFFLKISCLLPFSVFPRCQCVYTHQAGREPALQQNWKCSEKSQNFNEKTQYLMNTYVIVFSCICKRFVLCTSVFCIYVGCTICFQSAYIRKICTFNPRMRPFLFSKRIYVTLQIFRYLWKLQAFLKMKRLTWIYLLSSAWRACFCCFASPPEIQNCS